MTSQAHFCGAGSSSCTVAFLFDEIKLLFLRIESLFMRTSSSTYSTTYSTRTERRSGRPRRYSSTTTRGYSSTAARAGLSYYSILEAVRATGMRTDKSSFMLISRMLLEVFETLLTIDLASSSRFGLNMLTSDRSNESPASSS
jgi:hypothetical protein